MVLITYPNIFTSWRPYILVNVENFCTILLSKNHHILNFCTSGYTSFKHLFSNAQNQSKTIESIALVSVFRTLMCLQFSLKFVIHNLKISSLFKSLLICILPTLNSISNPYVFISCSAAVGKALNSSPTGCGEGGKFKS